MEFLFDKKVLSKLKKIQKKDKQLYNLVLKQLDLFLQDENHPSLRKHKLKGELSDYWSISVNMSLRLVYYLDDDKLIFIRIGTHDEVYEAN